VRLGAEGCACRAGHAVPGNGLFGMAGLLGASKTGSSWGTQHSYAALAAGLGVAGLGNSK
jgi:hypothetical protein